MNYSLKRYPSIAMIKKRIQYYDMKRKNFLLYLLFYLLSVIRMICSLDILYHFLIYFYIFLPFQSALTFITIFPYYRFRFVALSLPNKKTANRLMMCNHGIHIIYLIYCLFESKTIHILFN